MSTRLTELTIAEIQRLQSIRSIFAVGKYQGIPATLQEWIRAENITTTEPFDSAAQEQFGTYLLTKKRPRVNQYITGVSGVTIEDAQLDLAKEFASIPVATGITRPRGAGGSSDPGGPVQAGQSYYHGLAGNRAQISSEKVQEALRSKQLQTLKNFIAEGEGTYDSINIIPKIGDIARAPKVDSQQYTLALTGNGAQAWAELGGNTGGVSSNATNVSDAAKSYFDTTYINPLDSLPKDDVAQNFKKALLGESLTSPVSDELIINPTVKVTGKLLRDVVESGTGNNGGVMDTSGELLLLRSVNDINVEFQEQQKSIQSRIDGLLPAEAQFAVQYDLFEFFPDKMREKMSINAAEGINANYSHAWRSPGKLAITANLTIPGASGFRIGQIFWIGRTYEHYKKFGAFQLFGLTETIDLNRGWTTELYARFNAMPTSIIATATPV